jgi:multidrug efflux system membrane fusion protein
VSFRVRWLAALVLLAGCGGGSAGPQAGAPAVPVRVTAAERRDVPVAVRAIGNVEAFQTVTLKTQVEGQLAEVRFKEGDEVHAGDLLFVIDQGPFQAALDQAKANLVRAEAQAANAAVNERRLTELAKSGIVSRDEWDRAHTDAASQAASVEAAKAAVENAKLQLGFCSISSPLDGRIGRLLVNQGNVVKANDTQLATINQLRPIYVSFTVPEKDLPAIRQWHAERPLVVQASFPTGDLAPIPGELSFIDNRVDTTTGTVLLKGVFPNADEMLWPGQFVNVAMTLTTERDVLVVPAATVQTGQDGPYVFVVKADDTIDYRLVKVARTEGQDAVVAAGLEPGERVVTTGFIRLAPGIKVTIDDGGHAAQRVGDAR